MPERRVRVERLTDEKGKTPIQTYAKGKGPTVQGSAVFSRTGKSFTLEGRKYVRVAGGHWSSATHRCVSDDEYYRLYQL